MLDSGPRGTAPGEIFAMRFGAPDPYIWYRDGIRDTTSRD